MPYGTANARLKKILLFNLLVEVKRDLCFRCGEKILTESELSVEHKEAWLDSENPIEKFFDLDNVSFSHLSCNVRTGKRPTKKYFTENARKEAGKQYDTNYYNRVKRGNPEIRRAQYLRTGK